MRMKQVIKRMSNQCHRQIVSPPMHIPIPTRYDVQTDQRRLFYDTINNDGKPEKRMKRYTKAIITIHTQWGDKIVFMKTSLGQTYMDSRTNKRIDEREFREEATRILGSSANQMFNEMGME